VAATQAGMLNLAWKWQEAGSPIRAIHTYIELLHRYPDTPGAAAAVADLVALSEILTKQGQFHTALAIFDHLEELLT
jgi:TolA-binding protein